MMKNVLVVGGGMTSASLCYLLNRQSSDKAIKLNVWEKARGTGGRMATSRSKGDESCKADLGAQYFTFNRTKYEQSHSFIYNELQSSGLLQPLSGVIENKTSSDDACQDFVAPMGSSSVVKNLFTQSTAAMSFNERVVQLDVHNNKWKATTDNQREESFDLVILTIPVPQVLQLGGDVAGILNDQCELKGQLEKVEYSSRYALALFFDEQLEALDTFGKDVVGKYLVDHPIFRFVCVDNWKRGAGSSSTAVVFHTSVPFGKKYVESTPNDMLAMLEQEARLMFPKWPAAKSAKAHKWRYSQVTKAFEEQPGFVIVHSQPPLLLTGDAFTHSNFDGCLAAAIKSAQSIDHLFNN